MAKLTRREKLLLYILVLVLAVAAGWFLIKPAIEESLALDNAIMEAEMQKAAVEQSIATRPVYAESIVESRARIEALSKEFLPAMTNDDLDRYITGLLQRNGLVAESLLISASEDETASLAVSKLRVKVTASGELDQFIALVQRLSGLKGIRIAELAVRESGERTVIVPLTAEEIAELEAKNAGAKKKTKGAADTGVPSKEISVMEYDVNIIFEVIEFDEELFAAMGG